MGGLIGQATPEKNGLLSSSILKKRLLNVRLGDSTVFKIGSLTSSYIGIRLVGIETTTKLPIDIHFSTNQNRVLSKKIVSGEEAITNKYLVLKKDSDNNIYARVPAGKVIHGFVDWEGGDTFYETSSVSFDALEDI